MSAKNNTYTLLDSGNFEKLEQVGPYRLIRPSPQSIWQPAQSAELWRTADAHYHRSSSGGGDWEFQRRLPEEWQVQFYNLTMRIKLTNFGHIGLFPEQGPNWDRLGKHIQTAGRPVTVLNTFAYTGGSTLAAAQAGANVVHLDAARGIVSWASDNADLSGLGNKPIRWIIDDVSKFVAREVRRGNQYEAIILDPPSFGRGPKKEVWKFEDDVAKLLTNCRKILSARPLFVLLSAHTPGFTPLALKNLLADMMSGLGGRLSSAEMIVPETDTHRVLPSGTMAWWEER